MVSLSLFCCISLGDAYAENNGYRWWDSSDEGWFFYNDPPIEKENEIEKKEMPPNQPVATPAIPEKEALFSDQMKGKGQEYLSKAMQFPTSENIQNYMAWNKFMMDVSNNFSTSGAMSLIIFFTSLPKFTSFSTSSLPQDSS